MKRRSLGLRARVTLAFALGALLLSVSMAFLAFGVTRTNLVRQREDVSVRETYIHARLVREGLRTASPDVPRLLASLEAGAGSRAVVRHRGSWFSSSLALGRDALPPELRRTVDGGEPARQRFVNDGEPVLAVGVPVPAADALYFEVYDMHETDRALRVLSGALVAGAALTTLAGGGLGFWASRRALQPLREVSTAAADIASGNLRTRLDEHADSDLAALVSSFNRMVDALETRIERDARFASDVSHELRSPLTTIATSVEVLLSRQDELSDRGRRALELLAEDVKRFERLVQDLLEISRFDAGVIELTRDEVLLAELVRQAVKAGRWEHIEVEVLDGASECVVSVDKRRIERALANLFENASEHGEGLETVSVSFDGSMARVTVDDSGPGVPEEFRSLIFERFARGTASGQRSKGGGVGLGLSLVAEHIRLHDGRVWVEDAPTGGARFVVELPAEQL